MTLESVALELLGSTIGIRIVVASHERCKRADVKILSWC
jgi:hypothetical protein